MGTVLPTYSESVDALAVARQRLMEEPSLHWAVKAIRNAYLSNPVGDSDAIAAAILIAYSLPQERSEFEKNCQSAILEASMNLGIDPAVAAERWAHGEIATLAEAASLAVGELRYPIHAPTYSAYDELTDALKPFAKE